MNLAVSLSFSQLVRQAVSQSDSRLIRQTDGQTVSRDLSCPSACLLHWLFTKTKPLQIILNQSGPNRTAC